MATSASPTPFGDRPFIRECGFDCMPKTNAPPLYEVSAVTTGRDALIHLIGSPLEVK